MSGAKNVLGKPLQPCSMEPLTGWYRDGCCNTGPGDFGVHTVCVRGRLRNWFRRSTGCPWNGGQSGEGVTSRRNSPMYSELVCTPWFLRT